MKKYKDNAGNRVIEVGDISYLKDRDHHYNWFQRHWHHHRLRISIKKADTVIVPDAETAFDIHRYYFIPMDRIISRTARDRE